MLPQPVRAQAERLKADDGRRLNAVLQSLGLSQAKAARVAEIRVGWLNDIVNGKRAIGREDLRRLGRAGVPPDFVLGLTDTMFEPGASRTAAQLEHDLSIVVTARALAEANVAPWMRETLASMIGGADLIGALVRLVREECESTAGMLETRQTIGRAIAGLPAQGADDARRELQRAYAGAAPPSGRVFRWQPVTFTQGAQTPAPKKRARARDYSIKRSK